MRTVSPELSVDVPTKPVRWDRRSWAAAIAIVLGWSVWKAGVDPTEVINTRGWSQVQKFLVAMVNPDLCCSRSACGARCMVRWGEAGLVGSLAR